MSALSSEEREPKKSDADDTGSIHSGGSMATASLAMAAARVDLDGGYVAYVVSDEMLPADVRKHARAAEREGEYAHIAREGERGSTRDSSGSRDSRDSGSGSADLLRDRDLVADELSGDPGITARRGPRDQSSSRRPLWIIVQSDEPRRDASALQTPVPAPDVQPTRGILRHRHSAPLARGGAGRALGPPAEGSGPAVDWAADVLALGPSATSAMMSPGGMHAHREGAMTIPSLGGVSAFGGGDGPGEAFAMTPPRASADFRSGFEVPDSLAGPGGGGVGGSNGFEALDTGELLSGGGSPDIHSGASSGESSGDEGLSGDEASDGSLGGGDPLRGDLPLISRARLSRGGGLNPSLWGRAQSPSPAGAPRDVAAVEAA